MNNKLQQATKAYDEIFKLLDKHKDIVIFKAESLREKADLHLWAIELQEVWGLNVDASCLHSKKWSKISQHIGIAYYDGTQKHIAWEDDLLNPTGVYLLVISFPTGAYIFGEDYPKDLFREFFDELKSYNPKYCDTRNSTLYFSLDNAKDVYNNFDKIIEKYKTIHKESSIEREIKELETRLIELRK
jgi:hypothetical protein